MTKESPDQVTIVQALVQAVRNAGAPGGGPGGARSVIWPDRNREWESVLESIRALMPELHAYGAYDPAIRQGPALWLACVEARVIAPKASSDRIPVIYLPGISRDELRDPEDLPVELQPLAAVRFRGAEWVQANGSDWTPASFLSSRNGGLGCDVSHDPATAEAIQRALSRILQETVEGLLRDRLDALFFDGLLSPDTPRLILRWMNDPVQERHKLSKEEWAAFRTRCRHDFGMDPEKDGELRAAELLGKRQKDWKDVWRRFADAPQRYAGAVALLKRIDPTERGEMALPPDAWPLANEKEERELGDSLRALDGLRVDQAVERIRELEKRHGERRSWVWRELNQAPFACALEHLAAMAEWAATPLAGASLEEIGGRFAQSGWRMDAEAVAAMDCCVGIAQEEPLRCAIRALYLGWLDESTRNLQALWKNSPVDVPRRLPPVAGRAGRLTVFIDGLRWDVATVLGQRLRAKHLDVDASWDWAPFPSVTLTAKPFVSPVADKFAGGEAGDEFSPTIAGTGEVLTADRFRKILRTFDIDPLEEAAQGDPKRSAWAEIGSIDRAGHADGWKMVRSLPQQLDDIEARITGYLDAGWEEIVLVSDHGWLLMPGGLPKIELPRQLTEHRWGRCAAMRSAVVTDLPVFPWHWNHAVAIATPPGIGCFKAGTEFSHGGLSLQEMVVPRLHVKAAVAAHGMPQLATIRWVGLRCRVTVDSGQPGMSVDIRLRTADPSSSLVEGRRPRPVSSDGTVSLPVADPNDSGAAAAVVLLDREGRVIHFIATVLGQSENGGRA
ncbi:MAG: BREX-1 system phosphatase PglZ type B [Spirochaetia bacterium]